MSSPQAAEAVTSCSPQAPDDVVAQLTAAQPDDVRSAAARARLAFREWSTAPALERANALEAAADAVHRCREELTDLMVREVGKPLAESAAEIGRGTSILRYFAQQALDPIGDVLPSSSARTLLYTRRRPRGIAGLITPWNFPVAIPLWKAAPALAAGNTVLLKPAPEATAVALRLAEIIGEQLPADVLTVLPGGARTGRAVIDAADVVSFTGSVRVGQAVAAQAVERGIPFQTEMGGLNASIVLPDADIESAAATIAKAALGYAGQKCTATSRVIVVDHVDEFTDALVAATRQLPVGDPAHDDTVIGPVITEGARSGVEEAAIQARSAGGRVLVGGSALDQPGWFIAPTLIDGLPPEARLLHEEVFGPICAVISAGNANEAVAINNDVTYGLVTSVFTSDLGNAWQFVDELDTGLIRVNAPTSGVDFHAPFGGEKASSLGPREQGKVARDFYTSLHTVTVASGG